MKVTYKPLVLEDLYENYQNDEENGVERIKMGISSKTNLVWLRADSANTSVKTMAVIVPMT